MFARLFANLFGGWFRLSSWFPEPTMRGSGTRSPKASAGTPASCAWR
jgi:hypothetical protein